MSHFQKMYQSEKNVTIDCHIPRRNVTIHISNKTWIWEHYVKNAKKVEKSTKKVQKMQKSSRKYKIVQKVQNMLYPVIKFRLKSTYMLHQPISWQR